MVRLSYAFVLVTSLFASAFTAPVANNGGIDAVVRDFFHITNLVITLRDLIVDYHGGHHGVYYIHSKSLELYRDLKSAAATAEASSPFSDDEAGIMMVAVDQFLPTIHQLLHTMTEREPEIAKLPIENIRNIIKFDLLQLEDVTNKFQDALKQKVSEEYVHRITAVEDKIDGFFKETIDVY